MAGNFPEFHIQNQIQHFMIAPDHIFSAVHVCNHTSVDCNEPFPGKAPADISQRIPLLVQDAVQAVEYGVLFLLCQVQDTVYLKHFQKHTPQRSPASWPFSKTSALAAQPSLITIYAEKSFFAKYRNNKKFPVL